MKKEVVTTILDALESADLKNWYAVLDGYRFYYNNENAFNYVDNGQEMVVNFRSQGSQSYSELGGSIVAQACSFDDIHEIRTVGNYDHIKSFAEALGASLTDEQIKILLHIDDANHNI